MHLNGNSAALILILLHSTKLNPVNTNSIKPNEYSIEIKLIKTLKSSVFNLIFSFFQFHRHILSNSN